MDTKLVSRFYCVLSKHVFVLYSRQYLSLHYLSIKTFIWASECPGQDVTCRIYNLLLTVNVSLLYWKSRRWLCKTKFCKFKSFINRTGLRVSSVYIGVIWAEIWPHPPMSSYNHKKSLCWDWILYCKSVFCKMRFILSTPFIYLQVHSECFTKG